MAFSIPDPILAMIERKSDALKHIINQYPELLEKWEEEQIDSFKKDAAEFACSDTEVEATNLSSMMDSLTGDFEWKNMFYQSMLLMVVSYYESVVSLLAKEASAKELIAAICRSKNIVLSAEAMADVRFISEEVNALRNNICHNNFGTPRKTDVLQKIANKSDEIYFSNDIISITGSKYILEALDKESKVLLELADKLGYKNKSYNNGKVTAIKYERKD